MKQNDMISVCMATYNGGEYIKEQLNSVLNQLGNEDEVIISDDSSSDNTISVVKSLKDSRIKLLENQKFKSPVFNFENAIKYATGDVIFLCDQDDIWLPNKVKTMLPYLEQYDLVISDCQIVDGDLQVIENSFFQSLSSGMGFWKNFRKNTYLGCCMAFRKEILDYVLPLPPKTPMHDIWIGLCVEIFGKPLFLNRQLMQYRRHGKNASFTGERSGFSFKHKISYRLYLLKMLIRRFLSFNSRNIKR